MKWRTTAAILLIIAAVSLALNVYQYDLTLGAQSGSSPTVAFQRVTTSCSITGQSGGVFFRVLSDFTLKPVTGVPVTAINKPALCNGSPATNPTVETFTTNGTEWLPLPSDNNAAYSFFANYLGQSYNATANLRPVSLTCITLYVPSGRTNSTITGFATTCK